MLLEVNLKPASVVTPARVIVIEDNRSDVFLLERALNQQNFQFELTHLADGGQALAFIRREGAYENAPTPDLILVDLNLSKHNGEDLLREIHGTKHLATALVCAWSSSGSRRDRTRLMDLGVAQFVTKPAGLDQFLEIGKLIKDLLAGHTTVRTPRLGIRTSK
jgi:chemotaxis family two-component system response regulator Rcp1